MLTHTYCQAVGRNTQLWIIYQKCWINNEGKHPSWHKMLNRHLRKCTCRLTSFAIVEHVVITVFRQIWSKKFTWTTVYTVW